jgi:hypothetical protein
MATFLRGKGQILWDVTVNTAYVHPLNFLALGSRDMFDANNKAVNYLYRSLCQSEFERDQTEELACRIWEQLKNAHAGNGQVQARLFWTYRREYKNFTHLPSESIDAMSQCLTVIVNNMMANVVVLMVGELFSKLKSSEVDRGVRAKIENPTDAHSLALILVQGLMLAVFETIFLSCLVSMRDEEFDVLGEEDLALLSRRFERMYTNRKNAQKSSGMC